MTLSSESPSRHIVRPLNPGRGSASSRRSIRPLNLNRDSAPARHLLPRLLVVCGIVLAASIIALINFRSVQEEKTETLNVLNWTSYIPAQVIDAFEDEYHIKVNYSTYSSNEELLAKVSSAPAGTYDLIFPSDYMVSLMIYRDLLEPLDASKLQNLHNLDQKFLRQAYDSENEYSYPFLLATSVFLYDSSKLPRLVSYQDLLDPALENNLVLLDDQRIVLGAFLNALGYDMNDTTPAHHAEVLAFYGKLRPNVKAFDSDSPKTFFLTGEVDAGLIWSAEAILAREDNPNLKISYPAEGFALSMDNYCIPKDAKHADSAYLFIDYLLRPEVAAQIVAEYPYISPVRGVEVVSSQELEEILARGSYIQNVGDSTKLFDKLWAKIK